jgi:hypothetical protein
MRAVVAIIFALLSSSALAQSRQPAQITTLPTTSPQEFDLLDKTGKWMPFGTASGGVFSPMWPDYLDARATGAKCDRVTDDTAAINTALASGAANVRVAGGCLINGVVSIPQLVTLSGAHKWAGGSVAGYDWLPTADVLLGPSGNIVSGGKGAAIRGVIAVASNFPSPGPTNIRAQYNAARAFRGTAVTCNQYDFSVRDSLFIGFQYAIYATNIGATSQCDRLVVDQVQGDNTNGVVFNRTGGVGAASADVPRITNTEFFPFMSISGYESLSISNIANSGGSFQVTLSAAPPTPLQTGDIIQIGIQGADTMPTIYTSEPGYGWTIACTGNPNGTCTQFTLTGSTFAGSYTTPPLAWFSSLWREGQAFGLNGNVATSVFLSNVFSQSYMTAYYVSSGLYLCSNCTMEFQPDGSAPPSSIGIDVEGTAGSQTFIGLGVGNTGISIKNNTTNAVAITTLIGPNPINGVYYGVQDLNGRVQISQGQFNNGTFNHNVSSDVDIENGANIGICMTNVLTYPNFTITGARANTGVTCSTPSGFLGLTDPANGAGPTANLRIGAPNNANGASILLAGNGATTPNKTLRAQNGLLQVISSDFTRSIFLLSDNGSVSVPGTSQALGFTAGATPTVGVSCSGAPTASFAAVGGIVTHC